MDGTIADPGVAAVPGRRSLVTRRLVTRSTPSSAESGAANTGQAASKRRDLLFRRALLVADALAVIGAFVLTMELPSRSVQLTWASIAALPILLVGAKISGLYDRDDTPLRKTTLDEAPKLFQVATLCALVAWLTGGLIVAGTLDRREALFLWLALATLLMLMRTAARAIALRMRAEQVPPAREPALSVLTCRVMRPIRPVSVRNTPDARFDEYHDGVPARLPE